MFGSPRRARWRLAASLAAAVSLSLAPLSLAPVSLAQSSMGGPVAAPSQPDRVQGEISNAVQKPAGSRCVRTGFSAPWSWIHMSRAQIDRTFDAIRDTGASEVRFGVEWGLAQPTPTSWDWSRQDAIVDAATARGLTITGIINHAPSWANGGGIDRTPPKDVSAYAEFARRAAERYRGRISQWEVWNEPNLTQFWTTGADTAEYARMLKAAYPAIKRAQPEAVVISAGLAPAADNGTNIAPTTFVRQLYANGAGGSFDALGMHPYTYPALPTDAHTAAWNPWYQLDGMHSLMSAHGDGHKKIWLTEFGAPTGTGRGAVDPRTQATIYASGLQRASQTDYAGPLYFYTLRDVGTNPLDVEDNFGLYREDWSAKPSLSPVSNAIRNSSC